MLFNVNLKCVYNVTSGTKIYLGYKSSLKSEDKRIIKFSSRRKRSFFVEPGSDVNVIIYNRALGIYIVEKVEFDDNGVGSVEKILIENNIKYEQVSKELWDDLKKSMLVQSYIQPNERGYYMWTHFWLDIDVWFVNMISKDGIALADGKIIKEIHYKKVGDYIPNEIYEFLDRMINGSVSVEEYVMFKDMCTNASALAVKYKETTV